MSSALGFVDELADIVASLSSDCSADVVLCAAATSTAQESTTHPSTSSLLTFSNHLVSLARRWTHPICTRFHCTSAGCCRYTRRPALISWRQGLRCRFPVQQSPGLRHSRHTCSESRGRSRVAQHPFDRHSLRQDHDDTRTGRKSQRLL